MLLNYYVNYSNIIILVVLVNINDFARTYVMNLFGLSEYSFMNVDDDLW